VSAYAPGHIAENIAFFGRALRAAGIPVGPRTMLDAVEAVQVAGIGGRDDLYWCLHSVFVTRREHSVLFDQAFRLFWRRRSLVEKMIQMLSPFSPLKEDKPQPKPLQRVAEAMFGKVRDQEVREKPKLELDARQSASDIEVFKSKDFEKMTADEIRQAKEDIRKLVLPMDSVPTRRWRSDHHGKRIDPRRSFRATLRSGGDGIMLEHKSRSVVHPPIVALCDISGSMGDYSRLFLHFLHALPMCGRKVHSFLFATDLSNVTRMLAAHRDPELALAECSRGVRDWEGGTRISAMLTSFNRQWARRVLTGGAIVLFISDGLERDMTPQLATEMARLKRSCRRLIWLNPLLRYDAFEARASGIRALLPHVHEFRPIHSLNAMRDLCQALAASGSHAADPQRYLRAV
jgi:uncharacterized protein